MPPEPLTSCFQCLTRENECIPEKLVCDGEFDCTDGSDEFDCRTKSNDLHADQIFDLKSIEFSKYFVQIFVFVGYFSVKYLDLYLTETNFLSFSGSVLSYRIGDDLVMNCSVPNAVEIRWSKVNESQELKLPINVIVKANALTIKNLQPTNEGVYRCTFKTEENSVGFLDHVIHIQS